MILKDLFKHVYVINIIHMKQRWEQYQEEMKKFQIDHYQRFDGVIYDPKTRIGRETGCKLSHLGIIKMAKKNDWGNVLIMEDDVIFHESFNDSLPKVKAFLESRYGDWDMFYFGGNHMMTTPKPCGFGGILSISGTYTTHCYAVNKRAYEFILYNMKRPEMRTTQIDVFYGQHVQTKGKSFCIEPRVAFQRDGVSNILGIRVCYKEYLGG